MVLRIALAVAALVTSLPVATRAAEGSCAAELFARLRVAQGGGAWEGVRELSAWGNVTASGLRGRAEFRYDVATGRYAERFALPVQGTSAQIYDGKTVWVRDVSGGVHPYDAWYPRARSVTDAYLTRRAYLDPSGDARIECLGPARDGTRDVELVRVHPRFGIAAVLAVDRQSRLLDSIRIRTPITTEVTSFDDYRLTGRFVLPYTISSGTTFEPANGYRLDVTRYSVSRAAHDADFRKPSEADNARMLQGAGSTTVPMALEGRQLLVWASIDGRPPMPFILDTGGHAILDTVAAKSLGLRSSGSGVSGGAGSGTVALQYTRVRSVRIGDAELLDQPFLVIPYPYDFYERGTRTPLAGIIGLEWFERYVVRIDYAGRRVTLTPPAKLRFRRPKGAVPIRFQEDMPLAPASADGRLGAFGVDTGNAGMLVLYGAFLRRSGLLNRYAAGESVRGEGTGGTNSGRRVVLSRFRIGGTDLQSLDADFTQMESGSFSSWTEAGDLGLTVLSRFTPTFDYASETLYLEPSRALTIPPNRSGMAFTKTEASSFEVVAVRTGSAAAAAGIAAGDRLLAVDGKAAAALSQADLLDVVTGLPGTRVRILVQHANSQRIVELVLR